MSGVFEHSTTVDETKIEWRAFSVENADVKNFRCGHKDLDDFLTTNEVALYERENLGKTTLAYYNYELVAYFTVSMDSLRREYIKRRSKKDAFLKTEDIPALKIGRLAVAKKHQNKGFGRIIMKYITGRALLIGAGVGCRLLVLQAKPEARVFYEKMGFDITKKTKRERGRRSRTMYLDLHAL